MFKRCFSVVAPPPSYPETGRGPHHPPSSYPESSRASDGQTEGPSSGECSTQHPLQGESGSALRCPDATFSPFSPLLGPASSMESSSPLSSAPTGSTSSSLLLYQDQGAPPPLIHLPYEAPPPPTYLPSGPSPTVAHSTHPHPALLPHHSYIPCLPPSPHWAALQTGHTPRVYCPSPNPAHVVSYIPAPPPHHTTTHYIPPTM